MLTLPVCGYLKQLYPDVELVYLGKGYVRDVVAQCSHVDRLIEYTPESIEGSLKAEHADAIIHAFPRSDVAMAAKKAKIQHRIGTWGRSFHWPTCNHLIPFSRRWSGLHESQLNFKLLRGLQVHHTPHLDDIPNLYGLPLAAQKDREGVILHPGSGGSAVDWPIGHYVALADLLKAEGMTVYLTGTEQEGRHFRPFFRFDKRIIDMSGKLSLSELLDFIRQCELLVACSTGPLHIAAASGIGALGLFIDQRPIGPGRWRPVGSRARVITPPHSDRVADITPERVGEVIMSLEGHLAEPRTPFKPNNVMDKPGA